MNDSLLKEVNNPLLKEVNNPLKELNNKHPIS